MEPIILLMVKIKPIKILLALLCAAALAVTAWYFLSPKEQAPQYITASVAKGDIEDSVLATGILEATKMVSVGRRFQVKSNKCMRTWRSSQTRSVDC